MDDDTAGRARFWIGAGGEAPMYVQRTGLGSQTRPALVLIHGGGGQGLDWLGTPDGRPGWAPELARRGHRVYTVDRPGHGRGAQWAGALGEMGEPLPAEGLAVLFRSPEGVHPTAHLHTQWPGDASGAPSADPALLQLLASCRSMPTDLAVAQTLERRLGAELIDRIGPSVLFTHSAGAPAGWLIAADRPQLVRAIVALEPFGPPFRPAADGLPGLPHGLTAVPIEGLNDVPVLLVTAEASLLGHFDTEVRDYLAGAGAHVQLLRLAEHGIHGNGHGMIFERNHLQVLDVVMEQLDGLLASGRTEVN
jgi:pimeloyl-ACP methyl ester carboxylesterase